MSEDDLKARSAAAAAVLEKDVGTWDAEMEIHPSPGAPVISQRGVAVNRLVGGRWLVTDFRADSGFEGHGVMGWDAAIERYTGIWVDAAMASMARGEASWDAAQATMTTAFEGVHQGRTLRYREVRQTLEEGVQLYRHLVPQADGSDHEMIRAVYRRRA